MSKRYKSENTKEILLKGYLAYWLHTDWLKMKTPASEVEDAVAPSDDTQRRRNMMTSTTPLNTTTGYLKTRLINTAIVFVG